MALSNKLKKTVKLSLQSEKLFCLNKEKYLSKNERTIELMSPKRCDEKRTNLKTAHVT